MQNRKYISILLLITLTLQACSRGVAPTPGFDSLTSDMSEGDQLDVFQDNLCLLADEGADTDGDGVCDETDPNPEVAGCDTEVDPFCVGDEFESPDKNHAGVWILGGMATLALAWTSYAAFTGDWTWWNGKKDKEASNDFKDIVRVVQNDDTKVLISKEEFFNKEGTSEVWGMIQYEIQVGNVSWFPPGDLTQELEKGSKIKLCMTGKLGVSVDAINKQAYVSYHMEKQPYASKEDLTLSPSNFDIMCKNTQGVFLGYQKKKTEDFLYVNAYPIKTFNTGSVIDAESEYIVNVNYNFDSIPDSYAGVVGLNYHRENPVDNTKTMDYSISSMNTASQENYDACADDACRLSELLGYGPGGTQVQTQADPAQVAERISKVDEYLF